MMSCSVIRWMNKIKDDIMNISNRNDKGASSPCEKGCSQSKSIRDLVAESGIDEDVLEHIIIGANGITTDLTMPGGVPYMHCEDRLWSGAVGYDDMRGPQGRFSDLSFEEAFNRLAYKVKSEIRDPSSEYYYYNPEKQKQKTGVTAENDDIERCRYRARQDIAGIAIKDGVDHIRYSAFENCRNLESIIIPQSVKSIGTLSFGGCVKLKKIDLPYKLKTLEWGAFKNCEKLESITVPGGIGTVERETFRGCKNLKSAVICEGIETIERDAFSCCTELTTLTLPAGLKSIVGEPPEEYPYSGVNKRYAAFGLCDRLKQIRYCGSKKQWEKIDIGPGNESLMRAEIIFEFDQNRS